MPTAPSVPSRSPIQVLTVLFRPSVFPDTLPPLLGCLTARYFRLFNRTFLSSGALPQAGDNPLDECRDFIAYYKRCCDRALKKKENWLLTEPYRVQEEYRYKKS